MFCIVLLLTSIFLSGINVAPSKTVAFALSPEIIPNVSLTDNYTNVILLGWDGVQRNHLLELMNRGLMPNLSAYVLTNKFYNVTVSDHYTDTKAGWTQILTGYKWWRTGVYQNSNWFNAVPRGYTIPERLENIYGSTQISTAFIAGKLNQMEIEDGTGTTAVGSPFAVYSNQALYDNLPSQLDFVSVGDLAEDRDAGVVGPLMLDFLQNNSNTRFFAFFHFSDPDHIGHIYGENSIQYEQAIETCDLWLGKILNELNTLGLTQKTLLYITADHGYDEGGFGHQNAPDIFLATNDQNVIRNGDQVDIAPTVYYGLGLWNQSFSPALDGYPMQISLPETEAQHRIAVLADKTPLQQPSISITDTGVNRKTVTFRGTDGNLATVLLVIDSRLRTDVSLNWNYTGPITASGSYDINTTNLSEGLHSVKILSFDEHGANNGGIDKPSSGGWPASASVDFYVGTQPTVTPPIDNTGHTNPTSSHVPSKSPPPTSSPTPTPPSSTPTQTPNVTPIDQPNPAIKLDTAFYIAVGIAVVITIIGILIFVIKKHAL
jgi:hypothetical protein